MRQNPLPSPRTPGPPPGFELEQRAEAERQRAERLAEQLRALGIEPNTM